MNITPTDPGRRVFLKAAAAAALTGHSLAGGAAGANERIRLAFIGVGRAGSRNIEFAAATPGFDIAAVCDVYLPALDRAVQQVKQLGFRDVKAVKDFRQILADRSLDAVAIATPDHWHAWMTIEACRAGKDVWLEPPACAYVEEGSPMIEAVRRHRRVVQSGAIARSGSLYPRVRSILRRGDLGDIAFCRSFHPRLAKREGFGYPADSDPPPGLDWDLWLGPAGRRPFNINRWSHFRYFRDYAGESMIESGGRLLDLVAFAFGEAMPSRVAAQGGRFYLTDNTEAPDTMLVTCRYPGFVAFSETRTLDRVREGADFRGTAIYGSEATLAIHRRGYGLYPNRQANAARVVSVFGEGPARAAHWANFRDCIRSRRKPAGDIESCVRSTIAGLLADIALRHGVALDWDEQAFTVKQPEARCFLKTKYRAPWKLES